jgi:uncharacterized protein (DUF1330 family)
MRPNFRLAVALFGGVALGALVIQGLHAQATPPSYVITEISEITDPEGFKAVGGRSQTTAAERVQKMGGRYVTRTEKITAVDGTPPKRLIIIAFDNLAKAEAFTKSDSQKEIDAIRTKTTKSRVFIVEGL